VNLFAIDHGTLPIESPPQQLAVYEQAKLGFEPLVVGDQVIERTITILEIR